MSDLNRHRLRRRGLCVLVVVTAATSLAVGIAASPAFASGTETFMSNQGLSAGNAKASIAAHTGNPIAVAASSDHTFCPAFATGYAGYTSTPFTGGHTTFVGPTCGPGVQGWSISSNSYMHGAVYNPNISTFDEFAWADFYW
jgi:hypothetical protein